MTESPISLDYADIQGVLLNGYGHLKFMRLLFLKVEDQAQAKTWLKGLLPRVTSAKRRAKHDPKPETAVNIGLTWPGLCAFGIQEEAKLTFPREYWQGMGHGERTRVLGDTGNCAPQYWEFGGSNDPQAQIDLMLMFYGSTSQTLDEITEECWTSQAAASGLREIYRQDSHKESDKEPFGFKDGISQPAIAGVENRVLPGQDILQPGEFLLGYPNEYGQRPPMPSVASTEDPGGLLPADDLQPGRKALGNNGSYLVVRKLEQDVAGFWSYLDAKTKRPDGTSDREAQQRLAAKFVGRWTSGAPLTLAHEHDDPELGKDAQRNNAFRFLPDDTEGFRCPVGAHMRRANPRDTMPPNPNKSLQVSSHHRIIRRGRPYKETNSSAEKQGLIFIALNADLQRQFEFIQQTWINSPKFNGLYDNRDPLVSTFDPANDASDGDVVGGANEAGPKGTIMSIQAKPVRQRIADIPQFVLMKGGGYFFMPGVRALGYLANSSASSPSAPVQSAPVEQDAVPAGSQGDTPEPSITPTPIVSTTPPEKDSVMTTLNSLWSSVVAEGHELREEFENLRELLDLRLENLLAKPGVIRPLFNFMRHFRPIFVAPGLAAVSLYDDVLEVMANDDAFGVTEIYLKKMEQTTGDFVLGMPNTPQYQREIGLMQAVFHSNDLETIRRFVAETAGQYVAEAAPQGRIDLVEQLSRRVPTALVGAYFGSPGPDEATTMRWMRSIFREIFLNLGNDPKMSEAADSDARALNAYLDNLIDQRRTQIAAGEEVPDDFLCRLVKMEPPVENEVIRRIIGGTIVGAVDTNSKAIAQAVDQLLLRPLQLQEAHEAALADDDALLTQYMFEALRFNPQNPFLLRHCEKPTIIAGGTPRKTLIKEGTLVMVGTESAMFDPAKFPEPDTFWPNRPLENYIHFGHGLHTCFGRHIAQIVIPGTAKELLKQNNLRRASGSAGELEYDGAFPNNCWLEFDPA